MSDSLGVKDYFNTMDYLSRESHIKRRKERVRTHEPPHTPISRYVNYETAYFIEQFKSPRSSP